jgi:hypothetical protein
MGYLSVSPMRAETSDTENLEAHRLLNALTRLKEVRRRYAVDTGDGKQFTLTENCLDSIISDLEGWLKPGGRPIEFGDLDLRLAAVEEMIESTGLPAYAHVIASVRETLEVPAESSDSDEEPPPPQRYEPPPASVVTRSTPDSDLDEWEIRAAAESRSGGHGWLIWPALFGGCLAAAALLSFWLGETGYDLQGPTDQAVLEAPKVVEPAVAPATAANPIPSRMEEPLEFNGETLARLTREINLAEEALRNEDLHLALQHFATAAAIDRYHRRVFDMGGSLIDALLAGADVAFDNGEWELAADRIDNARHIARGFHLDTSTIDHTAQKQAAMTRFEDATPEDLGAFRRAVGHSVRVTLMNGDVLFCRVEAFEDNTLLLVVNSEVEGGGVQFSKKIPLAMIRELRIFDAERPSETVLGQ